jgi:uncharacterized OsmC-like protein
MTDATTDPVRSYTVEAGTSGSDVGEIHSKDTTLRFDASAAQSTTMPGPADLMTAAFAACIIKNVQRFSEILPFRYQRASVTVTSERQDAPPKMTSVRYVLTIVTDEAPDRVDLLHRNIKRHGTIYNTVAAACDVVGSVRIEAPVAL